MDDQRIPVESLDPDDNDAVARWATQLGVTVDKLREAVDAIGTDVDKIKLWLATHAGGDASS